MIDLCKCKKLKTVCFEDTELILVREGVHEIHSPMEMVLEMLRNVWFFQLYNILCMNLTMLYVLTSCAETLAGYFGLDNYYQTV